MSIATEAIKDKALLITKFESGLQSAVQGLDPYFQRLLLGIPKLDSAYVIDFINNELKRESNASVNYVRINI